MDLIKKVQADEITCQSSDFHKAYELLKLSNLQSLSLIFDHIVHKEVRTIILGILSLVNRDEPLPLKEELLNILEDENKQVADKVRCIIDSNQEDKNRINAVSIEQILLQKDIGKKVRNFLTTFQSKGLTTLSQLAVLRNDEIVLIDGLSHDAVYKIQTLFRRYGITDELRDYLIRQRDNDKYIGLLKEILGSE